MYTCSCLNVFNFDILKDENSFHISNVSIQVDFPEVYNSWEAIIASENKKCQCLILKNGGDRHKWDDNKERHVKCVFISDTCSFKKL